MVVIAANIMANLLYINYMLYEYLSRHRL